MENKYQSKVEKFYGPIYIPDSNDEIDEIIQCLYDSMESVSIEDFRIFQAIEIIKNWRNKNELSRNSEQQGH